MRSNVNPKTVFWIHGRSVPVRHATSRCEAGVVTILCSLREYECFEIDSEITNLGIEAVWGEKTVTLRDVEALKSCEYANTQPAV